MMLLILSGVDMVRLSTSRWFRGSSWSLLLQFCWTSVRFRNGVFVTSAFNDAAQGEQLLDGVQVAARAVLGKGEFEFRAPHPVRVVDEGFATRELDLLATGDY